MIFKIRNYIFQNTLKVQGKCWKDDVVTFTAHLSITIKRLTRYKQEVVLAVMLEGKSMPLTWRLIQLILLSWKIKVPWNISLKCVSSQISGVREFLCALSIFGISKIPTHCLKEALVTWPLSACGLLSAQSTWSALLIAEAVRTWSRVSKSSCL